jgi:hypothetical protein
VTITPAGEKLRDEALFIPENIGSCVKLTSDEAKELYRLLYKVIGNIRED